MPDGRTQTSLSTVKGALNPLAARYAEMIASVRELDDDTLSILADCVSHLTATNCWWAAYQIAENVQAEARWTLKHRAEDMPKDA